MAKKSKRVEVVEEEVAPVTLQPITQTLEKNYMPYAMTVIIARAIPAIDGFKPSHRKLLYTMYKMGLMTGSRTKSANVVGQTMRLNPHGDASIYETMVRLTRDNETLLHPFVDSKGTFGKAYSKKTVCAAPRYTEVKLESFCAEIFRGIDRDAVDFVDNYDGTMQEPTMLPTSFPNVLLSPNIGIAVSMASNICSFNLNELCDGTIQLLKNPNTSVERILDIIKAPDLPSGGVLLYDREQLRKIYETGKGSFKMRARYSYDKDANCIDVYQLPYNVTIEEIMSKMADMMKAGTLKEVSDFRDEIDRNGFKFTIDLKRGVDPDVLMAKLFHTTALESKFACNFNILIDNSPRLLGVVDILNEWIRFRIDCVKRELVFDRARKEEKLHLLVGLGQILLDIDKAIRIIRETKKEVDVIPNLMAGFSIDKIQAEYISEIKLRNLNAEYILNRIQEIQSLQEEIQRLTTIIDSPTETRAYIAEQLKEIKKKYGKPRMTQLSYEPISVYKQEEHIENYRSMIFLTREGYFKKIKLTSLRGNDEQRFKEGDRMRFSEEAQNTDFVLFFTDKAQVYRAKLSDFDCVKSSDLGIYIPSELSFEEDEHVIGMKSLSEFVDGHEFLFAFENGKCVRIPANSYDTKSNRKKLTKAFSDASPMVSVIYLDGNVKKFYLISDQNRAMTLAVDRVIAMNTRTARGSTIFQLKSKGKIVDAGTDFTRFVDAQKYWKTKFPASGVAMSAQDIFSE